MSPGTSGHGGNWGFQGCWRWLWWGLPCQGAPADTDRAQQGLCPGGGGCALLEGGDIRDLVNAPALSQMTHKAAFTLTLSAFVTLRSLNQLFSSLGEAQAGQSQKRV